MVCVSIYIHHPVFDAGSADFYYYGGETQFYRYPYTAEGSGQTQLVEDFRSIYVLSSNPLNKRFKNKNGPGSFLPGLFFWDHE